MRQSGEGGAPPRPAEVVLTPRRLEVVRTYLALDDARTLRPAADVPGITIERLDPCPVPLYRALYHDVGSAWYWHDRLEWSDAELERHFALDSVGVWIVRADENVAGFFELQRHDDRSVEIVYFGLMPSQIGRGIGGMMLTRAVREAAVMGARRVWLHTCTLDSPRALPSYQARGFQPYRTERLEVELDGMQVVSERLLPP